MNFIVEMISRYKWPIIGLVLGILLLAIGTISVAIGLEPPGGW